MRHDSSDEYINWYDFDENEEVKNQTFTANNITGHEEDHHQYYNSTLFHSKVVSDLVLANLEALCKNLTVHEILSNSHKNSAAVKLPFEFDFYGHPVDNITVVTSGFIYMGDIYQNFLSPSQYISPLMANFDTSISIDSHVKLCENGKKFREKTDYVESLIFKNSCR